MKVYKTEAREKVCPLRNDKCVASDCMMWRWAGSLTRSVYTAKEPTATTEEDAGEKPEFCKYWKFVPYDGHEPALWFEPRKGYCGLAGAYEFEFPEIPQNATRCDG